MNYHPICMQILRKEEKNMQQESVLNVGITKSFLLFWNHYDIHPEPLKGGQSVTYSRRISAHDRIIYDVYDDKLVVLVIKLEGHYDDK